MKSLSVSAGTVPKLSWISMKLRTVPADTDKLFMAVREAFVAQYDGVCIYSFITDQILEHIDLGLDKQAPTIPTKGSLDIKAVLQSDYCFA